MKITIWNVNGLRAVLARNGFDWINEHRPDILCLQEIKARPEQIEQEDLRIFDGYRTYWNPAKRPGYSGVMTVSKAEPTETLTGLSQEDLDHEGRILQTVHPGFRLFNIYFPNGQRDLERLTFKLDFYDRLLQLCDEYHQQGEALILCGDFNTAHQEIDLRNPKQNQKTSGFLPEEREKIDLYLRHNFIDIYRELYPNRVQYTWWTYRMQARKRNIGWRLDYFLISPRLMPEVRDVIIHEEVEGSDHCPVSLILEE